MPVMRRLACQLVCAAVALWLSVTAVTLWFCVASLHHRDALPSVAPIPAST
jgi:hypothetical protein